MTSRPILVAFASLNQVNAIKRELQRRNVFVEMIRTPQSLAAIGCSFALRCNEERLSLVRAIAEQTHVRIDGVFPEPEEGDSRFYASPSGSDEEA